MDAQRSVHHRLKICLKTLRRDPVLQLRLWFPCSRS